MPYTTMCTSWSLHLSIHLDIGPELWHRSRKSDNLNGSVGPRSCAMQAQAVALHVTMPELTTLNGALDRLDDYQNRAKDCLR